MTAHLVGRAEAECRMILAQRDELAVIVHHLRILLKVCPVDAVDAVGRVKAVVHAFLVAQHLLAAQDERHALRCHHGSLCKQVETYKLVHAYARNACAQTVN